MLGRHLKIGAGAKLVIPQSRWDRLMRSITGHIKIGANAEVVVVPDADQTNAQRTIREISHA